VPEEYLWIDEGQKFDFLSRTIYFWSRRTKGHSPKLLLGRSPLHRIYNIVMVIGG
jgi:hypothetical protein